MRTLLRLSMAALAALLTLGVLSAGAMADDLSINEQEFEVVWDADLGGGVQDLTFAGGGLIEVICPVTLLGTFHESTIAKVPGSDIGDITHAVVGPEAEEACEGGTASIHQETIEEPGWDVTYESFGGTLPAIDEVRLLLIGASFDIVASGIDCSATTTAANPAAGDTAITPETGQATLLDADETATIPLTIDDFLCNFATPGSFNGNGAVTDLDGGPLVIRLI